MQSTDVTAPRDLPIDRVELETTAVHFGAKPLGLPSGRLAHEAVAAAGSRIGGELLPDIFVKSSNAIVAQAANITHATTSNISSSAEPNRRAAASGSPGRLGENPATLAAHLKFDRLGMGLFGRHVRRSKVVMGC
jgi:hypothetical protein